jgi:hypothetical protein
MGGRLRWVQTSGGLEFVDHSSPLGSASPGPSGRAMALGNVRAGADEAFAPTALEGQEESDDAHRDAGTATILAVCNRRFFSLR